MERWEIRLALKNGCMLNVDSYFDAENIISVARQLQKTARVLIRVNPGLEQSSTPVHSYLSTALKNSKFGIPLHQFDQVYSNHNVLFRKHRISKITVLHIYLEGIGAFKGREFHSSGRTSLSRWKHDSWRIHLFQRHWYITGHSPKSI